LFSLEPIMISGREVLPVVEGGKGVSVSNGESSGAWAAAGGALDDHSGRGSARAGRVE
jgi:hypothetical protein